MCAFLQVRYLSLLIVDELFMRSKLFRTLIVENLDQLLTLSVGFRRNAPLPAPSAIASCLRAKAIEFLEKWNASFGIHYRQLRLGFDYLKNTLRLQFPDHQANAARIQQERMEREMRTREILLKKFNALKETLTSIKEEVLSAIDEIEQCLDIVRTRDELLPPRLIDDEDEFHSHELLQIRLASLKEGERVNESKDNKVVFDTIREIYRLLVTKHLPSVQESITVVVRVDAIDSKVRDSTLKELINIQNKILAAKKRCEDLVRDLSAPGRHGGEEEEDDFWEEKKVGELEESTRSTPKEHGEDLSLPSSSGVKDKSPRCSMEDSSADRNPGCAFVANDSDSLKSKLLAEAPVMKWGSYLHNWGSKDGVLANQRGLELENHWGRVEYDAVIPADKISELNVQATLYEEERVIAETCGAPLRNGSLCWRRDLKVCPFHGPVIPRDSEGRPIDQVSSAGKRSHDLQNDLVKKLAEQAVKNVRTQDREEAERGMHNKRALKRAKLTKIREHNEEVLRDAGLASTSRSATIGEEMDLDAGGKSSARSKKQTLSSMLRKKVTTKDKLSRRLLNARAADATTRQLAADDDQCYREAFPNQW